MVYFDQAGDNTERTLNIAKDEALKRGIKYVVVASTRGSTGVRAAQIFRNAGIKLIVVAHSTGHLEAGVQLLPAEKKGEIEDLGGMVLIGTDAISSFNTLMRNRGVYTQQSLIRDVLGMFGHGMRVCVEIVSMASDANLIPMEDVIAVAGSARGADTCILIQANSSNYLFDMKIREILAKPRDFPITPWRTVKP